MECVFGYPCEEIDFFEAPKEEEGNANSQSEAGAAADTIFRRSLFKVIPLLRSSEITQMHHHALPVPFS